MADTARRNRRILIAITAALAIAAIVVPLLSALLAPRHREQAAPVAPTTSTTPVLTIKPLGVRPVRAAFVTKPEECPPVVPTPPNQPLRTCDITRTAVWCCPAGNSRVDTAWSQLEWFHMLGSVRMRSVPTSAPA